MPTRLAQHLVSRGLLPADKVEEALRRQAISGGSLDSVLLEQGAISEAGMLQALADVSGIRLVNLSDFEPNLEVAALIPPKIAERLTVVPLSVDGDTLHVACSYPAPTQSLQEVGFLLGKTLELWVSLECRIRDWIAAVYKVPLPARYASLLASLDPARPLPPPPTPLVNKLGPRAGAQAAQGKAPAAGERGRDELSLEESLTRDMVEKLAQSVAEEPIPLEVRKAPRAPEFTRTTPEPLPPPRRPDPRVGAQALKASPSEHVETVVVDPNGYQAFARETGRPPTDRDVTVVKQAPPAPLQHAGKAPAPTGPGANHAPKRPTQQEFPSLGAPARAPEPPRRQSQPEAPAARAPAAGPVPRQEESWSVPQPAHALRPPLAQGFPGGVLPPAPRDLPMPGGTREALDAAPTQRDLRVPAKPPEAPAALPTPAEDPEREVVPEWTLAQARERLKESTRERERIVDVALRYGRRVFDFAAAFAVVRGAAVGWDARGDSADPHTLHQVSIPLDAASVFRTVAVTRGSYVGPLPPDNLSQHFLGMLGRSPRTVFLFPVEVKARLVAILYGDSGHKPISQRKLSDYILFCQDLPAAFQELILFRKQRSGPSAFELGADVSTQPTATYATHGFEVPPGLHEAVPDTTPTSTWSPWSSRSAVGVGRAASMPGLVKSEGERPPPDFGPILRRLTGPDAAQRARAMAELARSPEASARVLAQSFPGPTAWSRLPVVELPEADELGPVPAALSRLGRPAASALAPLLDSDDSDTRYLALLTAGNLPFPELVDGVLRGLFDLEPDISSAARAAATALRRLPRFDSTMKDLRQELAAVDPLRRALAARALGVLHDRESIDGLIGLTGSDDQMTAQAAAEALKEITKANFGTNSRSWTVWWAENRARRRVEWLVAGLRHRELEVRAAAIEELSKAFNDNLGYHAEAPPADREAAAKRWETALVRAAKGKFDL